eukprot:COSAG01_NODE_20631_length_944_cov_0.680473_1_plen_141_part_10
MEGLGHLAKRTCTWGGAPDVSSEVPIWAQMQAPTTAWQHSPMVVQPPPISGGCDGQPQGGGCSNLGAYEAVASSLVMGDKAFRRLRWALGRMVAWCPHLADGGKGGGGAAAEQAAGGASMARTERVVEMLREGWGGVLISA